MSNEPKTSRAALLDRVGGHPLLPMIYMAWVDLELSRQEVFEIRSLAARLSGEDEEDIALEAWLDPASPPSAAELGRLRQRIASATRAEGAHTLEELTRSFGHGSNDEKLSDALERFSKLAGVERSSVPRGLERSTTLEEFDEPAASFDPNALQRALDGRWRQQWLDVRRMLQRPELRYRHGLSMEQHREQVLSWLKILADEGWGKLALPERLGGQNDMGAFIQTFAALSMFDLSLVVKFGVQFGLFGGSVLFLGTKTHHDRWLTEISEMRLPGGFAMTETGHGSNVRELETRATWDDEREGFVIHSPTVTSRKEWIGNAARDGRFMTVFAQLESSEGEHGVHAFVVPVRDEQGQLCEGVRIEDCGHKMGLNGVDNGRIYFENVFVPRDHLLDRYASVDDDGRYHSDIQSDNKRFFVTLGTLVGGRVSVAAGAVVAARSALTIAIRYGAMRRQFGGSDGHEVAILNYKTHQLRLMPLLAQSYALHFAIQDLTERYLERDEETARDVESYAAGLKACATWHAIDAAQQARECCGGQGFLSENRIAEIRRDVDVFATFEGDNTVLMQLMARNLLTDYAKGFEYDLVVSVLRQITTSAKNALLEQNPVIVRQTDETHLRSSDFHSDILALRAHNLLVSAARRIRKRIDRGTEAFTAFNEIQDHLLSLAQAEMDLRIARAFNARVEQAEEEALEPLERLRALYVVDVLHRDLSWYLENRYMAPEKARALRKLRVKLCAEVRQDALTYTDAFGIPDTALSAPIAFEHYATNKPL